jgi:hypothetical protein
MRDVLCDRLNFFVSGIHISFYPAQTKHRVADLVGTISFHQVGSLRIAVLPFSIL